MTNLKTAAARIEALEAAALLEAMAKGMSARAYNRPRDSVLTPRTIANTPSLLAEFQRGWDHVDTKIAASV